ncbi:MULTISPECIES: hypothetical protein [Moorena]|nr:MULTISPECIES: hypothetical protein [Moorena]NEO12807.1 hypothetical protein [Moorena sp. SIO3E8]NEP99582.1 hypothetical protein [Moorena sp. SIO3F7]
MKTLYTLRAPNLYIALDLWSNKVSNAIAFGGLFEPSRISQASSPSPT